MGRPKKIIKPIKIRTFEECLEEINSIIGSRKFRWQLSSLAWIDFDDVKQILLRHIFIKWHLYDQTRPLASWVMTLTNNQMQNLIRNIYGSFSRPCLKCEFYQGDNLCSKFGEVTEKCELYYHWVRSKKTKYDIKLALPMENHQNEVSGIPKDNIDIEKTSIVLHERMKQVLKPLHYIVYKHLFVDHLSEDTLAKKLKLKSTENKRTAGYARISQMKREIIEIVRKEVHDGNIEIVGDNNI